MLLNLLLHKLKPTDPLILEETLLHLSHHYQLLLPGDKIPPFKTALSLSFDDGYFDFYHYLFPLLKKLNIKALLAAPAGLIEESTTLLPQERLELLTRDPLKSKRPTPALCTFAELQEMVQSSLVEIASHSFSHASLIQPGVDLEKEVLFSKELLENRLKCSINTFVYPYGHFNRSIHTYVKGHYQYVLRIGSALNFSWRNFSNLTYRQNIPAFTDLLTALKKRYYLSYLGSYLSNTLRGR
jgi:peptidoglycan/xylan/chitin deacetylase (PgdA/CDA1 family)